ncbi:MAG TPA: hypothetical protein VGF32_16715, partial [Streptosporangiaceae bacterium]
AMQPDEPHVASLRGGWHQHVDVLPTGRRHGLPPSGIARLECRGNPKPPQGARPGEHTARAAV